MIKNDSKSQVSEAIRACLEKKAEEITVLELEKGSGAFTDAHLAMGVPEFTLQAVFLGRSCRLLSGWSTPIWASSWLNGIGVDSVGSNFHDRTPRHFATRHHSRKQHRTYDCFVGESLAAGIIFTVPALIFLGLNHRDF